MILRELIDIIRNNPELFQSALNEYLSDLSMKPSLKINLQTISGNSLLTYALIKPNEQIADSLLEKGLKIDLPDCVGKTVLMHQAFNGRVDGVRYLLQRNASIEHQDKDGNTVFMCALLNPELSSQEKLTVFRTLIEHSHLRSVEKVLMFTNKKEQTVYHLLSEKKEYESITKLLRTSGFGANFNNLVPQRPAPTAAPAATLSSLTPIQENPGEPDSPVLEARKSATTRMP